MARRKVPGVSRQGTFYPTGWREDHKEVDRMLGMMPHPLFGAAARPLQNSGAGKLVLLYLANRKVTGRDFCHLQAIGDCVSHGFSVGIDTLKCVQIAMGNAAEQFSGENATEVLYGGCRVEVGGQRDYQDGAVGAWAAQYVATHGTLVRAVYGDVDLTRYDGNRAREYGATGPPAALDTVIRQHPVRTVSLVRNYAEARDAICNGYPVAVCSRLGFTHERDKAGFARQQGVWGHCTCFMGADDASGRPGLLDMNSWGPDWISGPKRHEQPDGSFWVDADVVDVMLGELDSFALSGYVGYPRQQVDNDFLAGA
jgi:hypothetical protein